MRLSSGFKKFLIAFGLVIILGSIGHATTPKPAIEGTKTVAPSIQPSLTKQKLNETKTVTLAPTEKSKPTIMPTLTPTKVFVAPTATPTLIPTKTTTSNGLSNDNYYTNSSGNQVHSPAYSNSVPAGASAICGDGTYSFSQSRRGTCSHHGGVAQWL